MDLGAEIEEDMELKKDTVQLEAEWDKALPMDSSCCYLLLDKALECQQGPDLWDRASAGSTLLFHC